MTVNLAPEDALTRFRAAPVARLATVSVQGLPHLVPVTFATWSATVVTAVDHKPKTTTAGLKRLRNIRATARASLLTDHYTDDWSQLWWVRVDGPARVVETEPERSRLAEHLVAKYEQYRHRPPAGPVIEVTIEAVHGWTAHGD